MNLGMIASMEASGYWSVFFFFSSRRRHTIFDCDWSSDVCSSDLPFVIEAAEPVGQAVFAEDRQDFGEPAGVALDAEEGGEGHGTIPGSRDAERSARSEERRVGKECRSRWSPYH